MSDIKPPLRVLIVTSWSEEGKKLYGDAWLETSIRFWPPHVHPFVVTDKMLAEDPEYVAFMERHKDRKMDPESPGYDYRFDLVRFAHKIFALKAGLARAVNLDYDWMIWLDGDVTTKTEIPLDFFDKLLTHDGVVLSRAQTAPHPECGFMAFNLRTHGARFIRDYVELYEKDIVLRCPELHDSHVFMAALVRSVKEYQMKWADIAPVGGGKYGLDAFEASVLGTFFMHRKGNRKFYQPALITNEFIINRLAAWRGCNEIVRITPADVAKFDSCPPYTPKTFVVLDCSGPVAEIRDAVAKLGPILDRVAFDGFYTQDHMGQHEDDTLMGVNHAGGDMTVFDSVQKSRLDGSKGFRHIAVAKSAWGAIPPDLPEFDRRILMPITQEAKDKETGGAFSTNMVVQTQNSADVPAIHANIKENLGLIKEWIVNVHPHRHRFIIASAGESLLYPETLDAIRAEVAAGARLLCVKHSHNKLIERGIIPWGCVLLDPRPHEGYSTHGEPRKGMITPDKRVIYFVASMVHPSVVKALLDAGVRVVGWHAAVGAREHEALPKEHAMMLMGGGSSSAGRAVILAWQFLGAHGIGLYAFDSCHLDTSKLNLHARHQDGTMKYIEVKVESGGREKTFVTDRDILCQAQDFTKFLHTSPWIHWDAHGPGMLAFLYENGKGRWPKLEERFG